MFLAHIGTPKITNVQLHHAHSYFILYNFSRYAVKEQIGGVKILGRSSTIQDHPLLGAVHGKVYSRLLFGKMLLASSQYNRGEVKDDTLVSYREEQLEHGIVDRYVSYCDQSCHSCQNYCKHVAIVMPIEERPLTEVIQERCGLRHMCIGLTQ